MTHLIAIDGPRGSGAMQVAQNVMDKLKDRGFSVDGRWSVYEPDALDSRYLNFIVEDGASEADFFIWQGSWASDHVWGKLKYNSRMATAPDLGEWFYGRWFCSKNIILGPGGPKQDGTVGIRDKDIEIDVSVERDLFQNFGRLNNWQVHRNTYSVRSLREVTENIIEGALESIIPLGFYGSGEPDLVVLERNTYSNTNFPIPFTAMAHHPILMGLFPNKNIFWALSEKQINLGFINRFFCPVVCLDEQSEKMASVILDNPSRVLRINVPVVSPGADYLGIMQEYWVGMTEQIKQENESSVANLINNEEELFAEKPEDFIRGDDEDDDDEDFDMDVDVEGEER